MWVDNGKLKENFSNIDYDRSKITRECGIFKDLGSTITNDARSTSEINYSIALSKAAFNKPKSTPPANWTKI
jgi:hypothetical protein